MSSTTVTDTASTNGTGYAPDEHLYSRAMRGAAGRPEVGPSARTLGVRPGIDVEVIEGAVAPGGGGLSVAPGSPELPPTHRRPIDLGSGRDPVWSIAHAAIGPDLVCRRDSASHALVEPARRMKLGEYQAAIAATAPSWSNI